MITSSSFKIRLLAALPLVGLVGAVTATALELTPVGSINDGLYAPTSLYIHADELAVLEPFSQQLKIYTPDGARTHQIDLTGDAYGLTKRNDNEYLYCDRARGAVVVIDRDDGTQIDLTIPGLHLEEPVDLALIDQELVILDAGQSALYFHNEFGSDWRELLIRDSDTVDHYYTSLAYDSKRSRFYVMDQLNSQIKVVDTTGLVTGSIGGFGNENGAITRGGELAVDRFGRLFVTDRFQGTVLVYAADGRLLGQVNPFEGAVAIPAGIAVDENGVMYVASSTGRGISMFLVQEAPTVDEAIRLVQRYPSDAAELAPETVYMAAEVEIGETAAELSGFDFQLYTDTTLAPLAEISGLDVQSSASGGNDGLSARAEWIPEIILEADRSFFWRLRVQTDTEVGLWSAFSSFRTSALPTTYSLGQNYPNPFNPTTRINFSLAEDAEAVLEVFNLLGQNVATLVDEPLPAGNHTTDWDGRDDSGAPAATGVYFYRIRTDNYSETKKMVLIK